MIDFAERSHYTPSGRMKLGQLLPSVGLMIVLTAATAAALYGLLANGLYLLVFAQIIVLVNAAAFMWKITGYGHCRNQLVAGGLGAMCGLGGYLGYFHVDQCLRWHVPWTAVGRLPNYIAFRMETDAWEKGHRAVVVRAEAPVAGVQPQRPLAGADFLSWHWLAFFVEAGLMAAVPAWAGVLRAGRPYSEQRGRWCSEECLLLETSAGSSLQEALASGAVAAWVDSRPRKVSAEQPHCTVSVWYTPARREEEHDGEAYVSVAGKRALRLYPEEAAAFVLLLPGLQDLAGPALSELAHEANNTAGPESARVWPVPPPFAGQAQNPWNRLIGRWLRRGLAAVAILPLVLLIGGTYLLTKVGINGGVIVAYVITVGIGALLFVAWWHQPERLMAQRLCQRFDWALLRRAIAARQDPLVRADDPRAVFAEMSPRRFWTGERPECGDYNQGLLRVDQGTRALLFEGDYECYWIPADAIRSCTVEALGGMTTTAAYFGVVLHVNLGTGTWEFPLFPLANIQGNIHWERAMTLLEQLETMCGRSFGSQPPRPAPARMPVVA